MRKQNYLALVSAVVLCLCPAMLAAAGPPTFRVVALTGDMAPGTPEGVVFLAFGSPTINAPGHTAFHAFVSDGLPGVWSEGSGTLELVARFGDPAPDTPEGVTFTGITTGSLSIPIGDAGAVTFRGLLNTVHPDVSGSNDSGIWSGGSGSLSLVAREGDQAPGAAEGVNFGGFGSSVQPILNSAGEAVFRNILTSFVVSIWAVGAGGLEAVVIPGQPAPGTLEGVVFSSVGTTVPVLSGTGWTALRASISGPGVDGSNNGGIWAGPAGGLQIVARAGDQAPGLPEGVLFGSFIADPVINDTGQTAFSSFLTGAGVNSSNDWSLWSEGSGTLALLAREGNQASGAPDGVAYFILAAPVINSAGQAAFWSLLSGPGVDSSNDVGLWSGAAGSLALMARKGSQAPGTASGVVFNVIDKPAMNGAGHVAFSASLLGPGVNSSNDQGLWAQDASGVLTLIARTGDSLEIAAGDFRTIGSGGSSLEFAPGPGSGGQDGRPTGLNDAGQLTVRATFTDNSSGILVFSDETLTPGDLDGNGEVRVPDLIILLSAWGPCPEPCTPGDPAATCPEDLDGDCEVRVPDLIILLSNWG